MDSFGRVIAILLTVILVILFPLQYVSQNQKSKLDNHVQYETKKFAAEVMMKGYISWDMYQKYLTKLSSTNQLYDIELVHSKQAEGFRTSSVSDENSFPIETETNNMVVKNAKKIIIQDEQIVLANNKVSNRENTYKDKKQNFLVTKVNLKKSKTNTVVNKVNKTPLLGVKAGLFNNILSFSTGLGIDNSLYIAGLDTKITSFSAHTHTDACYATGTTVCTGIDYNGDGNINYTDLSSQDIGGATYCTCRVCNQIVCIYSGYMGSMHFDYYPHGFLPVLSCDKVVLSITPTNSNQTVNKGQSIITTATATYLDGHTGIVNCTSNFNTNTIGSQSVTLTYSGLVDNAKTTGTKTCTVQVTVNDVLSLSDLYVTPRYQEIPRYTNPTFVVNAYFNADTVCKQVTDYTISGFNNTVVGTQIVTISYTYGSTTITDQVTVKVLDIKKISEMYVSPPYQEIARYTNPIFEVYIVYDDGSWKQEADYTISEYDNKVLGIQNVKVSYSEGGITLSQYIPVIVKRLTNTCPICGLVYELDDNNLDHGCPSCSTTIKSITATPDKITVTKGGSLYINVIATYKDEHTEEVTGWTSSFDNTKLGDQLVAVTYGGFSTYINVTVTLSLVCPICGTVYQAKEDGTDPGCPVCKKTVVSISATPETQAIQRGDNMQLIVVATYHDGHKEEVTDWTSDLNSFKVGKQTVNIYYKSKTTAITVYVQSETQATCPICGTVYNPIEHPNGCLVCADTVVGIEARLRNGGTQVQLRSELSLYVILIYKDNHREITYSDWSIEGYQAEILGNQTITVKYKQFQTTLAIEVVNSMQKKVCPNGHVYYLNEDGSDPGCPYCNEDPTTDSSQGYSECIYTQEILNELYINDIYYFNEGDCITITVKQKNVSFYEKLGNILHTPAAKAKKYTYGGMIGDGQ